MPTIPSPSMLRGLISGKKGSTVSLDAAAEPYNLEEAMRAANYILNDDLDSAEAGVKDGSSAFHKLGRGMVSFMRATLGFEADMMRQASDQLATAEAASAEDQRRTQRDPGFYHSAMYPVGSEYALCHAMSQLMAAVVAVMSESLTEGLRGFYKLRKAYITLDSIVNAEARNLESASVSRPSTPLGSALAAKDTSPRTPSRTATYSKGDKSRLSQIANGSPLRRTSSPTRGSESDEEDDFQDADESHDDGKLSSYVGRLDTERSEAPTGSEYSHDASPRHSYDDTIPPFSATPAAGGIERLLSHDASADLIDHPVDVFVHSGTNLCYGLLLTMLSLVPPAFGRLLTVVGFRGDRARGLRMLWSATRYPNINGAFAGFCLLGYYNGIVGSCDILPDPADEEAAADGGGSRAEAITGYPARRLEILLADMQARYPRSKLWRLEQARMHAARRNLSAGLALLAGDMTSPLKQVQALAVFERGLQAMDAHEYALCAECFQECTKLNLWSHGLYLFIAGSAHVEMYRHAKAASPTDELSEEAQEHAEKAMELLQSARAHAGKKRFLARQLPLETYVVHSLTKWEAAARAAHVPFVDAIGTSPLEVMAYIWAGHKKMAPTHLEMSLAALDYAGTPVAVTDAVDEKAMHAVLRAACLRSLGRLAEAREVLARELFALDRAALKGPLKDDWPAPVARYEMAAVLWAERGALAAKAGPPGAEEQRRLVREAEEQLGAAAKWERYMLDARVGVRVTTGLDTVRRWRAEHDASPAG